MNAIAFLFGLSGAAFVWVLLTTLGGFYDRFKLTQRRIQDSVRRESSDRCEPAARLTSVLPADWTAVPDALAHDGARRAA